MDENARKGRNIIFRANIQVKDAETTTPAVAFMPLIVSNFASKCFVSVRD